MYKGKKQLIWLSLMTLLLGISALVYAQQDDTTSTTDTQLSPEEQVIQQPSELPRADMDTSTSVKTTAYGSGWDTGYKAGYNDGKADHDRGAKLDADDAPNYKGYRSTFDSSMGKRSEYKKGFKQGFKLGYEDGYSGRMSRLITSEPSELARTEMFEAQPSIEDTEPHESTSPTETEQSFNERDTQTQSTGNQDSEKMDSERQSADLQNTDTNNAPSSLPRTASNLPLLALLGLAGVALSFLLRALRSEV